MYFQKGLEVKSYTLDGTIATEFTFQVTLIGLVAEASDNHGFECITTDVWVFIWLIWKKKSVI